MPKKHRASIELPSVKRKTRSDKTGVVVADSGPGAAEPGPPQPGLVVANHGLHVALQDDSRALWHCTRRRSVTTVVAGDQVIWQALPDGTGVIIECLPRTSLLARPDRTGAAKPIAANIDRMIIVAAVIPPFNERLIDRYIVGAEISGIQPLIVVNKIDLLDHRQRDEIAGRLSLYREIGYEVLFTSTIDGAHLQEFANRVSGKTSVLVGKSGAGKSSLINTLLPDLDIRIAALSEATSLGRHTTTATMLYELPGGGNIIDSPGIRDFSIGNIGPALVERGFIEFRSLHGRCKFNDCLHRAEHHCAVKDAVESGAIHRSRYLSYLELLNELAPA
ncbi:MAG: ribosome small subunit-dependent GTPase A [Gammaproteobacteria bacterium]|nr:MAG: ribosome small subunit-dependent GTPase A [Gammaproteobacteria bacterium]TND07306.1 MAG: ribosome small subunit-dependent GTPase A [Gammaproteobacteria bacterium]